MRIALRTTTTNPGTTNPLPTQSQPTGASFLSVLFGTTGTSTQGAGARNSNPDAQSHAQTTSGQQQESTGPDAKAAGQPPIQGQITAGLATLLMNAAGVVGAGQTVARFQSAASTTTAGASTAASKDTKTQSDSASTLAAATPVVTTPVPQQIVPTTVQPAQQVADQGAIENDAHSATASIDAAAAQSAILHSAEFAASESRNQAESPNPTATQTKTTADPQSTGSHNPATQPANSDAGVNSATSDSQAARETQATESSAALPQGPMFLSNVLVASPNFFATAQSSDQGGVAKFDSMPAKDAVSTSGSNAARTGNSADNSPATPASTTQDSQAGAATQHMQTDASQAVASATKPVDATPLQTMTVQVSASSSTTAGAATDATRHADAAPAAVSAQIESSEGTAASGVNTARVIQSMSESEMRVGMRSTEFGDISIRTAVAQQQMVAQITVDHGDLGRAIALHAPAAQTKLGEDFGLHASIEVTQSGTGFSGERGNSPHQRQRAFAGVVQAESMMAPAEMENTSPRASAGTEGSDRLDIRA